MTLSWNTAEQLTSVDQAAGGRLYLDSRWNLGTWVASGIDIEDDEIRSLADAALHECGILGAGSLPDLDSDDAVHGTHPAPSRPLRPGHAVGDCHRRRSTARPDRGRQWGERSDDHRVGDVERHLLMGVRAACAAFIVIVLCGGVSGCGDAREARSRPAAISSVAVGPSVEPVGLTSDGVVALDGRGIVRIQGHRRQRLVTRGDLLAATASEQRLAVIVGRRATRARYRSDFVPADEADRYADGPGTGRTRVLAGTLGGRLREVADCAATRRAVVAPAVAGATVAWRGCDGHTVEVDQDGRRSALVAGGTPVALAAAGRLVGWIAARGRHQPAVVKVADLDTGTTVSAGEVPAVSPLSTAGLALTAAGRSRAMIAQVDDQANAYCEAFSAEPGRPLEDRGRVVCAPAALTEAGAITLRPGATGSVELTLSDDDGRHNVPVASSHDASRIRFVAEDRRIAYTRPTCTQQTLTVASIDQLPTLAPVPRCPLKITTRRARASSAGQVHIRVACSRGCRLDPGAGMLILGQASVALSNGRSVVRRPGGHVRLAFTLSARARHLLKAQQQIRATVTLTGLEGTQASAVLHMRR